MAILLKAIYRFNSVPIKWPMTFFWRTRTNNPKTCIEPQKTQNCQSNSDDKEQRWRYKPPRGQIILQVATVIKKWYWHKHMNQCNRTDSPETNPTPINLPIWQRRKDHRKEKRQSLRKSCWESWTSIQISEVRTFHHTIHKNKLKIA